MSDYISFSQHHHLNQQDLITFLKLIKIKPQSTFFFQIQNFDFSFFEVFNKHILFRNNLYRSFGDYFQRKKQKIRISFFERFLCLSQIKITIKQSILSVCSKQKIKIPDKMDRKTHLLSDLKKQVLILKTQLDNMQRPKNSSSHNKSSSSINKSTLSQTSRFNERSYDSTYLDKGVKKFPLEENSRFRNLKQMIDEKSKIEKRPTLSQFRRAEDQKTKQNFSTEKRLCLTPRNKSPNPLTGQGYSDRKKGIKTKFQSHKTSNHKQYSSGKKHYPAYLCR